MRAWMLGALIAGLWAAPTMAQINNEFDGSVQLGAGNPIQFGRLVRGGIQQDFANDEPFPGTNNPTIQFHYAAIPIAFAPNALQDVFYEITFDDAATDLFASAYNGTYTPANLMQHWLGDEGGSGEYVFYPGLPGDVRFFEIMVPRGGSLTLVINDTVAGLGTSSTATYSIQAYSDSMFDTDFLDGSSVPEPASWALMIAGFGAVGAAMRRRGGAKRPSLVG